jgi:hypothetical protein
MRRAPFFDEVIVLLDSVWKTHSAPTEYQLGAKCVHSATLKSPQFKPLNPPYLDPSSKQLIDSIMIVRSE